MRLVRNAALVAVLVLAVVAPGASEALPRELAAGSGTWAPPPPQEPSIPEQERTFSFFAASTGVHTLPCPAVAPCGLQGFIVITEGAGRSSRGRITCLSVDEQEAFMTAHLIRGNIVQPVGVYAHDRRLTRHVDRLAIVPAGERSCHDADLRDELRAAAAPLRAGDVTVLGICGTLVCTQPDQLRSASMA